MNTVFKIIHGDLIIPPDILPKVKSANPFRTCNVAGVGLDHQLYEPVPRILTVEKTFFYSAPRLWNRFVSPQQANAPSIEAFKSHFRAIT